MPYCNVNNVESNVPILGIVEPCKQFCDSDRALVAEYLVTKSTENKVPVRLMNLHNEETLLRKGTFIAELNPEFEVMTLSEKGSGDSTMLELPIYLQDLFERSTVYVEEENKETVSCLCTITHLLQSLIEFKGERT